MDMKYRVWDSKKMWYPGDMKSLHQVFVNMDGEVWMFRSVAAGLHEPYRVLDVVVMHCTCLKDNNGGDIYDGDIIGYTVRESDQKTLVAVYDKRVGAWAASMLADGSSIVNSLYNVCVAGWTNPVVIGNIYENPELMGA